MLLADLGPLAVTGTDRSVCYLERMPTRKGTDTRDTILAIAHRHALRQGFAAASLEGILTEAGVTKGAFFHHFKSKGELAHALVERYARGELQLLEEITARAEKLSRDPLQQVLLIIGLFDEFLDNQGAPPDGCLFASFCYQDELFSDELRQMAAETMLAWRKALSGKLRAAADRHGARVPFNPDTVADMFTTMLEGAFVVARTLNAPHLLKEQLLEYRNHIELLFDRE